LYAEIRVDLKGFRPTMDLTVAKCWCNDAGWRMTRLDKRRRTWQAAISLE
jgi:hypothetical protein